MGMKISSCNYLRNWRLIGDRGMSTSGCKTRRMGDRELKRLECSVNYDVRGGEPRRPDGEG